MYNPRFSLERGIIFLLLLSLVLLTAACSSPSGESSYLNRKEWSLSGGAVSETPQQALEKEYAPVAENQLQDLSYGWNESGEGVVWLRREFTLPAGEYDAQELYTLRLGRLSMADETYLNGSLIGSGGQFPPHWFSDWNRERIYDVPASLLKAGETNTILIKLWGKGEIFQQGVVILGPKEEVSPAAESADFFASEINALAALLIFIFGLYHILLYVKRPRDKENLYYAVASVALAFYSVNFFATKIPGFIYSGLSYLVFQKLIWTAEMFTAFGVRRFIREFLKRKDSQILKIVDFALLGISLVLIWAAPNYTIFQPLGNAAQIYVVMVAVYSLVSVISAQRQGVKEAMVLLIGMAPFMATIFFDLIVHQILKIENTIYLGSLGFPLFLLAILFILASRFVKYHNQVEDLNIHLEQKVAQRTEELEESNKNLAKTLGELQEANATAERDMQMAVMIQQGLYQQAPPPSGQWEVSHYFQPMAGVSGDLYDYYSREGELRGAALFDVSGHGISSGLITMIAKSVTERNFVKGMNKSLGKVMQAINVEMIHEIGKVENYVTGILVRLTGNLVEYANAGHTDMLLRRGRSGEVIKACPQGKDMKGLFLGIEGMESTYGTLKMETQVDDTLLIYSDCLTECRRLSDNEEYGMERLTEVFKEAPKTNTDAIRDYLVERLKEWRGAEAFGDDFTFMVLRRKRKSDQKNVEIR